MRKQIDFSGDRIRLGAGTYYLPDNFFYDYGDRDIILDCIPGKTFITSDFKQPPLLDITIPDKNKDGIYVVWRHEYFEYGGGCAHLNLKDKGWNTGGKDCFYIQGTLLQKSQGVWSRYTPGFGLKSRGGFQIYGATFQNFAPYIFTPAGKTEKGSFVMHDCKFENVTRVFGPQVYAGVQKGIELSHLECYPSDGQFRFDRFEINNCIYEQVNTHILNGCPPSGRIIISGNKVYESQTIFTAFNLFMKSYDLSKQLCSRSIQTISNNWMYELNTQQYYTTSLIRTSGVSFVRDNSFQNTTANPIYLCGGSSKVERNNVVTDKDVTCILIKGQKSNHDINTNFIVAPKSRFVALEGESSVEISGRNNIKCSTVYSRVDQTPGTEVLIEGNNITADRVVYLGSKIPTTFDKVTIQGNILNVKEQVATMNVDIKTEITQ